MQIELEKDLIVIGEPNNGLLGIDLAPELNPDVVLVDFDMPEMDGIAITRNLHALAPHIPIILLSLTDDTATRDRAHEAGAAAFVTKQANPALLLSAIREVAKSES